MVHHKWDIRWSAFYFLQFWLGNPSDSLSFTFLQYLTLLTYRTYTHYTKREHPEQGAPSFLATWESGTLDLKDSLDQGKLTTGDL